MNLDDRIGLSNAEKDLMEAKKELHRQGMRISELRRENADCKTALVRLKAEYNSLKSSIRSNEK